MIHETVEVIYTQKLRRNRNSKFFYSASVQIIGGDEDTKKQHRKIQQVMDITGKEEDEVATALFDAGWDENRAVELLLEGGSSHGAWEESGGKKKKKQLKQAAEEKVRL